MPILTFKAWLERERQAKLAAESVQPEQSARDTQTPETKISETEQGHRPTATKTWRTRPRLPHF